MAGSNRTVCSAQGPRTNPRSFLDRHHTLDRTAMPRSFRLSLAGPVRASGHDARPGYHRYSPRICTRPQERNLPSILEPPQRFYRVAEPRHGESTEYCLMCH